MRTNRKTKTSEWIFLSIAAGLMLAGCSSNATSPLVTASAQIFSTGFENTAVGDFPSGTSREWGATTNPGNGVDTSEHHSGTKSLRLVADPTGCLSSALDIPVTPAAKVKLEYWMMCEGNYAGGCHNSEGNASFVISFNGANATTLGGFGFQATPARVFTLLDTVTAVPWTPMTWYKIDLELDTAQKTTSLSVNDQLIATRPNTSPSFSYQHVVIESGDATVWVDDVSITKE